MKKLKLKALELNADVLTRNQLKNVLGGDGSGGSGGWIAHVGFCSGTAGLWYYNPVVPWDKCMSDIQAYCSTRKGYCD